jgi:hypothetical protein
MGSFHQYHFLIHTQILSDLIEDLAINLQVTEEHVRNEIDSDRATLGLKPLPPHQDKPGTWDFLKTYQGEALANLVCFYLIFPSKPGSVVTQTKQKVGN